jgi:maleate cis-trans isomerase
LPEGIGVIITYAGVREQSVEGFHESLERYDRNVAKLASLGVCDLIQPEGAPPFMVRGVAAEREIVERWEAQHQVPVFTSSMIEVAALQALDIHRFVGFTYYGDTLCDVFSRYFSDAGFDVAGMVTMPSRSADWPRPSVEDITMHISKQLRNYPGVQGIYLHGPSGWGRVKDIMPALESLGVPVVHQAAARVWYVQKRLHVSEPVPGAGRLLETMP